MRRRLQVAISLCIALVAAQAMAEESPNTIQVEAFSLNFDVSISQIQLSPGGFIQVSGVATYQPDGTVWDAATEQTSSGRRDGGLIDAEASGLVLRDRDSENHAYTYEKAETESEVCVSVGLPSPCLVLRLPALAASKHRDLGELREEIEGSLDVALHAPVAPTIVTPPPPVEPPPVQYNPDPEPESGSWFWTAAITVVGGALIFSVVLLFLAARRRRKSKTPVTRAKAAAGRLRKKLAGDPVRARLLKVVNHLAEESLSLQKVERQLMEAVRDAKVEELERRHADLKNAAAGLAARGGTEAGEGEIEDAAAIVEGQIERCRRWEMQRWRSAARMERIATRLEALEAELNDPAQGKLEAADGLLSLLQEELELARAGEQEAQRLLGGGS